MVSGFFPGLTQPLPVAASGTGQLYAIDIATNNVSAIDPSSGTLTPLASVAGSPNEPRPGFGGFLAADPAGHRLFVMTILSSFTSTTTTNQLNTIDTRSGTVQTAQLTDPLDQAVYDTASGRLLGITSDLSPEEIVSVDPTTGAETQLAAITGDIFSSMAIAPTSDTVYVTSVSFATDRPTAQLMAFNLQSNALTAGPVLARGGAGLLYDTSLGSLFEITFNPAQLVRLDATTGVETPVGNYDFGPYLEPKFAIDSASHTVFAVQDVFDLFAGPIAHIASVNDQTGAGQLGGSTGTNLAAIGFVPVPITAQSIQADVRQAASSGAISNAGVTQSLLAKLEVAAASRSRGQCATASNIYQAFVTELKGQSGKAIASSTVTQLTDEAEFLITNCP